MRLDLELGHPGGQAELRPERVLGDRGQEVVDALDADALQHRGAIRSVCDEYGFLFKLSATSPRRRRPSRRCGAVVARREELRELLPCRRAAP